VRVGWICWVRERESWARVGRSLASGRSVGVGWICWVRERERVGQGSVGNWPLVDRWGSAGFAGSERELGEGRSVVGRWSIGGGRLDLLGPRERERERDFLPPAFSTFLFDFFFLIKKEKRCATWVESRTLDARITLLLGNSCLVSISWDETIPKILLSWLLSIYLPG